MNENPLSEIWPVERNNMCLYSENYDLCWNLDRRKWTEWIGTYYRNNHWLAEQYKFNKKYYSQICELIEDPRFDNSNPAKEPPGRRHLKTEHARWSKEVKKRDNFICQDCGEHLNLHAHHIKSWVKYIDSRFDLSNGITLCRNCHKKIHHPVAA